MLSKPVDIQPEKTRLELITEYGMDSVYQVGEIRDAYEYR